jgi:hypothetical protein
MLRHRSTQIEEQESKKHVGFAREGSRIVALLGLVAMTLDLTYGQGESRSNWAELAASCVLNLAEERLGNRWLIP